MFCSETQRKHFKKIIFSIFYQETRRSKPSLSPCLMTKGSKTSSQDIKKLGQKEI